MICDDTGIAVWESTRKSSNVNSNLDSYRFNTDEMLLIKYIYIVAAGVLYKYEQNYLIEEWTFNAE